MTDWLRSVIVLAAATVGVVVVTLGLATVVVPRPVASQLDGSGASAAPGASGGVAGPGVAEPSHGGGIPGLGGTLTVTGDREGTLRLTRDSVENRYALVGGDGRITFEGQPAEVVQLSYDGWEFFPEPDECTVTTGNLEGAIGIGFAELTCTDIADIRDNGVISISGTIGLPIDRLVPRELPPTGGTATVGPETWTFEFAYLAAWQQPILGGVTGYNMELVDVATEASLLFTYDLETHETALAATQRGGEIVDVPEGGCGLVREVLGKPSPRATTIQLTISCPEVEVAGLGAVPVESTVVVDELEWPE